MSGFGVFARKEVAEILRTWRIRVLPAIVIFFAIGGPLLARFTPEIVGAVGGDQLHGLTLPPPTYSDAYAQWVKNLGGVVIFALVIMYGGVVSSETRSGTALLVLTKPLSRAGFLMAKVLVHSSYVTLLVVTGTALTWAMTAALFGSAPAGPLWASTLAWLVLGIFMLAVMILLSVSMKAAAGAAAAGLAVVVLLAVGTIWHPLAVYTFAGLTSAPAELAAGREADVLWPVVSAVAGSVLVVAGAVSLFRRVDL